MNLTPKQKRVLDFIETFIAEKGYSPSQREIADHLGVRSLGTVQIYLARLKAQGRVVSAENTRRGLTVRKERL